MTRRITILASAALLVATLAPGASAQWGYGMMGWGGWGGGSIEGDVARGMGVFAAGAGQFNQQTAVARSIETDTRMRLNEYLWQSEQIRRRQYYQQVAARSARTREAADAIRDRHLNQPQQADVVNGDALNAIMHQLNSPGVPNSLLINAGTDLTLTGEQIRRVPLRFASKGVVISAHRMAAEGTWPLSLQGEPFDGLRKQYQELVEEARDLPEEQEIPDELIVRGIGLIDQMRAEAQQRLQGREFAEAERFLKAHAGLLQMARQPNIRQVLEAAYKKDSVTLPNALIGMSTFNLSFGRADDPEEQALYLNTLYPMLAELRGRVTQELGGKIPDEFQANVGQEPPLGAFEKLPWEQLSRDEAHEAAPEPVEPDAPGAGTGPN